MRYLILLAAFVVFLGIDSQAEEFSAATRVAIQGFEKTNKDGMTKVNKYCGSNIKITQDWESFKGQDFINKDLTASCLASLDALGQLCREDELFKAEVASKIKEYKCVYGSDRTVELKNGIVTNIVNPENYTKDMIADNKDDPENYKLDFAIEYFKSMFQEHKK